jgi:hypothetical protein
MASTTRKPRPSGRKPAPAPRRQPRERKKSWFDFIPGTDLDEYLGPWIGGFVAVPAAGMIAHAVWGESGWRFAIAAVLVLAGAGFAVVTLHEAKPRGDYTRWRAAVTVAFALLSVAITTLVGFVSVDSTGGPLTLWVQRPWVDGHSLLAALVALSWNIRRSRAVMGEGHDEHPQTDGSDDLAEILGVKAKVRVVKHEPSEDGVRHEFVLSHKGAQSASIAKGMPDLLSLAGLPPTAARVIPDPTDASKTRLTLVTKDVLAESAPWPGPSRPGQSIAEPCRLGRYEDGSAFEMVRPGDPKKGRNARSYLVMGMPGAGKTEAELHEVSEIVTRPDVVLWWVDTVKGAQTADDILPAVDWCATGKAEAAAMAKALRYIVNYRAGALALLKKKFKAEGRQWTPDAWKHLKLPYLIVHIEEFADVAEFFDKDIVRLGEQVRSVGISLSISLQRASADNINTSLRSSLGGGWCFGIKDSSDANMALSDTTLSYGADPGAWADAKPGMSYLESTLVAQERWAMPARTFLPIPPDVLHWHVAWWAPVMAKLDQGSIASMGAYGKTYGERQRCNREDWMEAHEVELMTPPAGTPEAAVRAVAEIAVPALQAAGVTTEFPPALPSRATSVEEELGKLQTNQGPITAEEEEDEMRSIDQSEARQEARELYDDEESRQLVEGIDPRVSRALEPVDPEDDMVLGDELPQKVMTPEEADAALIEVFRGIFAKKGNPEWIEVDTSTLGELWAETGIFSYGNPRAALGERLHKLAALGFAERVASARGRRPASWRVRLGVLNPPIPSTGDEPGEDPDAHYE